MEVKVVSWLFLLFPGLTLALMIIISSIDSLTVLVVISEVVTETTFVTPVVVTNMLEVIDVDVTVWEEVVDSVVREVNV